MSRTLLLFVVALAVLANNQIEGADLTHTKDPLPTVKARVIEKKAVLVDVRSEEEWKEGHINGAVHLPWDVIPTINPAKLSEMLPKDKIIYTHCAAGVRSLKAGKTLQKLGYDVRPLEPGYEDLVKAGFQPAK